MKLVIPKKEKNCFDQAQKELAQQCTSEQRSRRPINALLTLNLNLHILHTMKQKHNVNMRE